MLDTSSSRATVASEADAANAVELQEDQPSSKILGSLHAESIKAGGRLVESRVGMKVRAGFSNPLEPESWRASCAKCMQRRPRFACELHELLCVVLSCLMTFTFFQFLVKAVCTPPRSHEAKINVPVYFRAIAYLLPSQDLRTPISTLKHTPKDRSCVPCFNPRKSPEGPLPACPGALPPWPLPGSPRGVVLMVFYSGSLLSSLFRASVNASSRVVPAAQGFLPHVVFP